MHVINRTTAAKLIVLWNLPALLLLAGMYEVGSAVFAWLIMASSNKSPKNWPEWNKKYFTVYAKDSCTGEFVRFTTATFLFVPVGFLAYTITI